MRSFSERIKGAMLIDVGLYEEVEADSSAMWQAMGVVVLASVATGVGVGLRGGLRGLVAATTAALFGWLIWAGLTHLIGTRILPEPQTSSTWGQVLRTTGFAAAPGFWRVFAVIPVFGAVIYFLVGIWMLVAFVVAVRQALDYRSTWRAVAVCLTGWLVFVFVGLLLVPFAR